MRTVHIASAAHLVVLTLLFSGCAAPTGVVVVFEGPGDLVVEAGPEPGTMTPVDLQGSRCLTLQQTSDAPGFRLSVTSGGRTMAYAGTYLPGVVGVARIDLTTLMGGPLDISTDINPEGLDCSDLQVVRDASIDSSVDAGFDAEEDTSTDASEDTAEDTNPPLPEHCTSGAQDGDETDVDCGGSCLACDEATCASDEDCLSTVCGVRHPTTEKYCLPSCDNGVRNGSEIDIDCGAESGCGLCPERRSCNANEDCVSGSCQADVCRPSQCGNGTLDGNETGVDCGGSCGPCELRATCRANTDCGSGTCSYFTTCHPGGRDRTTVELEPPARVPTGSSGCLPGTLEGICRGLPEDFLTVVDGIVPICSPDHFREMLEGPEGLPRHFVLGCDLDLGWAPLPNASANTFQGHFDGHFHEIRNLASTHGVFGNIGEDSTIENVVFNGLDVRNPDVATGGLAQRVEAGFLGRHIRVRNAYVGSGIDNAAGFARTTTGTELRPESQSLFVLQDVHFEDSFVRAFEHAAGLILTVSDAGTNFDDSETEGGSLTTALFEDVSFSGKVLGVSASGLIRNPNYSRVRRGAVRGELQARRGTGVRSAGLFNSSVYAEDCIMLAELTSEVAFGGGFAGHSPGMNERRAHGERLIIDGPVTTSCSSDACSSAQPGFSTENAAGETSEFYYRDYCDTSPDQYPDELIGTPTRLAEREEGAAGICTATPEGPNLGGETWSAMHSPGGALRLLSEDRNCAAVPNCQAPNPIAPMRDCLAFDTEEPGCIGPIDPDCDPREGFTRGGTRIDPHRICSVDHLDAATRTPGAFYRLACDLSVGSRTETRPWPTNFDGNGHQVSNVTLGVDLSANGLFGTIPEGTTVSNLHIRGLRSCAGDEMPVTVGLARDIAGAIENVRVDDLSVLNSDPESRVAAVAERVVADGRLRNIFVSGRVEGGFGASGIVYASALGASLSRLRFSGSVIAGRASAGIVINPNGGLLSEILVDGRIHASGNADIGRAMGVMGSFGHCEHCLVRATVTSAESFSAGGFHSVNPSSPVRAPSFQNALFYGRVGACTDSDGSDTCEEGSVGRVGQFAALFEEREHHPDNRAFFSNGCAPLRGSLATLPSEGIHTPERYVCVDETFDANWHVYSGQLTLRSLEPWTGP